MFHKIPICFIETPGLYKEMLSIKYTIQCLYIVSQLKTKTLCFCGILVCFSEIE